MQIKPRAAAILFGLAVFACLASYGWGKGAGLAEHQLPAPVVTKEVKLPSPTVTVTKKTNTVPQSCLDLITEQRTNIAIQVELAKLPEKAYTVSQMNRVLEVAGRESDSTDRIKQLTKTCNREAN